MSQAKPFGEDPFLDSGDDEALRWEYWERIWPSPAPVKEYLIHQFLPSKLAETIVLDLGCGIGLVGVVVAQFGVFTMFSDMFPLNSHFKRSLSCQPKKSPLTGLPKKEMR